MINFPKPEQVVLSNGIFKEREQINRAYLLELDSDCLLQNFYFEAGICTPNSRVHEPEKVKMHWGWESPSCQLRGHFLGHWLSAASMLVAVNKDKELEIKLNHIIDELDKCQSLNGGKWVGSIPEKYFYRLETDEYIWSPQYTMHKTCMGLMNTYQNTGNKKALKILNNLADWYVKWVNYEKKHCPKAIYNGEQGGMLEIWATMYEITKLKKYMELAEAYSNNWEFQKLYDEQDALTNIHTNASIPLAHGACKMFEVTGDEKWKIIAGQFWRWAVEERGYFCTGGNNSGEFWIPCKMQGHFLNERDQEFCTVYNMCRFAQYMFKLTGDKKYEDFIELNIYNGFLAQQNKFTGMPTYFLPLNAGGFKTWGSRTKDFWCCHGTMIQSQTIYGSLCYAYDDSTIYINQYIPSIYKDGDFSLEQFIDMHFYGVQTTFSQEDHGQMSRWQLKFIVKGCDKNKKLYFRIPEWIDGEPKFKLNGKDIKLEIKNGYAAFEASAPDFEIQLNFVPKVYEAELPDDLSKCAVREGPIVLAGLIDYDCGLKYKKNISEILIPQYEHQYSAFTWKQGNYNTLNQDKNFSFIPLYEVTDEKYTVYFTKK